MMRIYRWNAARARVGSTVAVALVGGGLLLTASNGIAAETTKRVEQKVRTILPVAASLPPAAPAAPDTPAPPPAPHAPLAPVAPEAPIAPPAPPVPPVPPTVAAPLANVSWSDDDGDQFVDTAEINRDIQESVREAQAEARAAAREAQSEALATAREAAAEARVAAREAVRVNPVVVTKNCPHGTPFMAKVSDDGHAKVYCGAFSPVDRAKMRKQMIASLEQARRSVAASLDDDWARRAREQALASIDREIARLKSEK